MINWEGLVAWAGENLAGAAFTFCLAATVVVSAYNKATR